MATTPICRGIRGRTALVTGAGKRVGRAIAVALAENGAHVVVHYNRSADEAAELARDLSARGVNVWTLQADLADEAQAAGLVPRAIERAGGLDILVNSASIFPRTRMAEVTWASLEENLRVNAWAPLLLSRAFAEHAKSGHIVNLLDSKITGSSETHVTYLLSKQMLAFLTRQLAASLAPNVTVNAVAPGLILPPDDAPEGYGQRLVPTVPMARMGTPEDVAEAVVYLVSSRFVTGQVIFVDGGWHLRAGD
jgi:pteridine reductase